MDIRDEIDEENGSPKERFNSIINYKINKIELSLRFGSNIISNRNFR